MATVMRSAPQVNSCGPAGCPAAEAEAEAELELCPTSVEESTGVDES